MGDERPSMFADMIVIVEGSVTVVEQRYDLYSWYIYCVEVVVVVLIALNNL